jgi:two-component system, cell cycle sensor histidine kinase DivJ
VHGNVGLFAAIRDYVDALMHPSAQQDALASSRHRAFIAPRLLGGLVALAAFPVYLAMRGVPSVLEVLVLACLTAPILIACFLARTGRYERAHMLFAEEDPYRSLARNMTDVITRHGRNGTVLFVSPAAGALFGAKVKDLLGHGLFDRVHVADRPAYLTALADAATRGESRSVEFRARRDSTGLPAASPGQFIWIEMRCRPLDQAANEGDREVVSVMRDATERKVQQQVLEDAHAEAERASVAKSRFLATMSHELRTPLNAIIGFSEMLTKEGSLLIGPERRHEYAHLINDSGHHLLAVVNGILDMSKIETGNFEIAPEPFAPEDVIGDACGMLALKAREAGIELVTRIAEKLPQIVADKRALSQIMLNLVSNAIKFTDRGGQVVVSVRPQGGSIAVTVEDNGVGIGAEDLPRVGDPFFQARSSYDRRHDGTGLGLSIVKGLLALHGSELEIRSRLGEGTCVTFHLPVDCAGVQRGDERPVVERLMPRGSEHPANIQTRKSA